jgi:hypothetical protein
MTYQEQVQKAAKSKILATVKTCLVLFAGGCKKEALERLRDDVVLLFNAAVK